MSYNIVQDYTEHKYIEHKFTLDCKKSQSQVSIPVRENDTAIKLFITLQDGREPFYIEDGCISAIFIKKSDGTICENACIIEDNRTIRYDFTEGTANVEGINDCEVRVYSADGTMLTSPRFIMVVTNRVLSDDKITKDERTIIDNILLSELGRVTAENSREEEETARRENEAKRVQAEGDREDTFSKKIDEINGKLAKVNSLVFDTKEHLNQFIGGYESTKNLCPLPKIKPHDYYILTHNDNGTFNFDVSHDIGEPEPFGRITLEPGVYVFTRYNCEFYIGITFDKSIPISKPFEVTETTEYSIFSSGYAGDSFKNAWVQITKGESVPDEFIPYYAPYTREDGKTVNDLSPGDILLITEEGVSDYWWDGNAIRPIEAQADQTFNPESENAQSGTAVTEAVSIEQKRADNTFANALKGSKSGSAILIDDVSPVTHDMSVKVRSKNILPYPYAETTKIESGITITDSGDGSISLSGTSTAQVNFYFSKNLQLKKGITYTLSASGNYSFGGTASFYIYNSTYGSLAYINLNTDNSYTFTPTKDINGINCYIAIPSDRTVSGIFKPQLELGSTSTVYTPYVPDLTSVKVSRCGKNLLPPEIGSFDNWENIGTDGITKSFNLDYPVGIYTFSVELSPLQEGDDYCYLYLQKSDDNGQTYKTINQIVATTASSIPRTFTIEKGYKYRLWWWGEQRILENYYSNFQLEYGSTATDYEPYISPTDYTPTADGTIEGVTSLYPNTTLMTDTDGVIIDCEYNRDINKALAELQEAIISLSGNI